MSRKRQNKSRKVINGKYVCRIGFSLENPGHKGSLGQAFLEGTFPQEFP